MAESILTARTVTTAAEPHNADWPLPSASIRAFSTAVSCSVSVRTASRRKAAFRTFDSTIVSFSFGRTTFSGIAGDPLPEPRSSQTPGSFDKYRAAANGSTNSRSNVSSVGGRIGNAVRLIFTFHRSSRTKYASSASAVSGTTATFDRRARRISRSRKSRDVTQ